MGMWGATSLERSYSSAMRDAYPLLAFKVPTLDWSEFNWRRHHKGFRCHPLLQK
jgi:hypothetical protein